MRPRPRRPGTAPSNGCASIWRGPVISTQVIADAAAAGFSCTVLYQARIALGVRLQRFLVSARGTCGVDTTASGPGSPRGRGSINQSGDVGGDLSAHPSRRSTGAVMIGGDAR